MALSAQLNLRNQFLVNYLFLFCLHSFQQSNMSRGKGISLFLCSLTSISLLFLSYTEAFLPSPSVEHRWMNQSRLYARKRRRNPSRFNEDHEGNDPMNNNIPQLPPSTGRPTTILQKSGSGKEDDPPLVTRKFQLSYTCKVCDTKNSHMVSRVGKFFCEVVVIIQVRKHNDQYPTK